MLRVSMIYSKVKRHLQSVVCIPKKDVAHCFLYKKNIPPKIKYKMSLFITCYFIYIYLYDKIMQKETVAYEMFCPVRYESMETLSPKDVRRMTFENNKIIALGR